MAQASVKTRVPISHAHVKRKPGSLCVLNASAAGKETGGFPEPPGQAAQPVSKLQVQ